MAKPRFSGGNQPITARPEAPLTQPPSAPDRNRTAANAQAAGAVPPPGTRNAVT